MFKRLFIIGLFAVLPVQVFALDVVPANPSGTQATSSSLQGSGSNVQGGGDSSTVSPSENSTALQPNANQAQAQQYIAGQVDGAAQAPTTQSFDWFFWTVIGLIVVTGAVLGWYWMRTKRNQPPITEPAVEPLAEEDFEPTPEEAAEITPKPPRNQEKTEKEIEKAPKTPLICAELQY